MNSDQANSGNSPSPPALSAQQLIRLWSREAPNERARRLGRLIRSPLGVSWLGFPQTNSSDRVLSKLGFTFGGDLSPRDANPVTGDIVASIIKNISSS